MPYDSSIYKIDIKWLTKKAIFILFICSVTSFFLKWSHVIGMLISLELSALALFIYFVSLLGDYVVIFMFLVLVVADSVLGLVFLILMVRSFGNDSVSVMLW